MSIKIQSFIIILLFASITSYAEEPVTSLRGGMLNRSTKEVYIAASYPVNHTGYESQLKTLWDSTNKSLTDDSYRQKWKKVSVKSLEAIFGHIDKQYYVIYPISKMVKIDERSGRMEFDHYKIERREVQRAALFEWECDGEIIPVLSLGNSPGRIRYGWEVSAISIHGSFEKARLVELDKSLIPQAYLAKMGDTNKWVTIEWPKNDIRATMIKYSYPTTGEGFVTLFAIGKYPGNFSYLERKFPLDVSC
jgi:hypothetical protein